jgi:hypothetical protein
VQQKKLIYLIESVVSWHILSERHVNSFNITQIRVTLHTESVKNFVLKVSYMLVSNYVHVRCILKEASHMSFRKSLC